MQALVDRLVTNEEQSRVKNTARGAKALCSEKHRAAMQGSFDIRPSIMSAYPFDLSHPFLLSIGARAADIPLH